MQDSTISITVGEICEVVKIGYNLKRPVLILSDPGLGKSSVVRKAAAELGVESGGIDFSLIDFRGTTVDPVDLRGMPITNAEEALTRWLIPSFFPRSGNGIFFLDEISAAPPMVQSALLQLVLDRRLGDYVMPDGWYCVAAGNLSTNRAGSSKLNTALASRFIRYRAEADPQEWVAWASENGLRPEVTAFIKWKPELLHQFDPSRDEAFPCPRTWEYASDVLGAGYSSPKLRHASLAGCVGGSVAAEFCGFLTIFENLKSPETYLKNPEKEPLPTISQPAVLAALAGALSRFAIKDVYVAPIFTIAKRLPAEFATMLIDQAVAVNPDIQQSSGYIEWTAENQHMF